MTCSRTMPTDRREQRRNTTRTTSWRWSLWKGSTLCTVCEKLDAQILYTPSKYGTQGIQCSTLHNIVYHNSSTTFKGCLTVLYDLNRSKHISVQWWKDQIRMCQSLYSFASIFLSWLDLVLLELFPELNKVNWWVMLWLFQCNFLKVRHLHVC